MELEKHLHDIRQWVRKISMFKVEVFLFWSQGFHDATRDPNHRRTGRNRFDHHRTATDSCPITNADRSQDGRIGANDDTVSQSGMTFLFFKRGATQHNAFIYQTIVPDLGSLPNHHAHSMVDKKAPADFRPRMNLNSCESTAKMRDQTGSCKPFPSIEGIGNTVKPDRMETGIAEKNLHMIFSGRISLFHFLGVFLQSL